MDIQHNNQSELIMDIKHESMTDIQHNNQSESIIDIKYESTTDIEPNNQSESIIDIKHESITDIQSESIMDIQHESTRDIHDVIVPSELTLVMKNSTSQRSFEIAEADEEAWSDDNLNSHPQCLNDAEFDSFYKRRAVEYWRKWKTNSKNNKKKNRSLKSVQNNFRRVSSERQLRRWEKQLYSGGNRIEKLFYISKFTYDKFTAAVQSGFMVHNIDIKRWALQAQEEMGNLSPIFNASRSWISKFKLSHRIVSRKVSKFVTNKTIEDSVDLQKK